LEGMRLEAGRKRPRQKKENLHPEVGQNHKSKCATVTRAGSAIGSERRLKPGKKVEYRRTLGKERDTD